MSKSKITFLFVPLILFALSFNIYSQNNSQEKYSKVKIYATSDFDFSSMSKSGLHLEGGIYKPGLYFETWLSESEIKMLKASGVSYDITIPDWMQYYNSLPQMSPQQLQEQMKKSIDSYSVSHSIYGTMGGFLKWEEAITKLDSMRMLWPNLISAKFSYGNSYENRPLWTVRVTKNPDAPTGRPEIWLNGVTHAREPEGMMNIFYYLYWLFENFNIDPIATYILNNREIYFTPFLNPDGYYYNQTTNPTGGGMWRKNRQPYGGSTGTDLNRNFGTYNFWNSSNGGSSTLPSDDTYRGPYPFSAKEDSLYKVFFNSRNFKVGLDYHTYGNYLIKPYAWCDPTPTPDDAVYNEFGADITADNHFTFGTPFQTVAYYVRGGDIDWCYSNDSTGHTNHRFFMTPEVGVISFWPPAANILPEVQTCLWQNTYICLVAGAYPGLKNLAFNKSIYTQNETGNVKVVFRNKGLMDAQNVRVEFTPLNGFVNIPVQLYSKASMISRTSDSVTFNFTISGSCPNGNAIPTRISIKQNDTVIIFSQTYYILVGNGITTFADSAENGTANWTFGTGWGINTTSYHSPTHSFAYPNYPANTNNSLTLSFPLNLSLYPVAYLEFWHRYDVENTYDFCYVEVSSDNGTTWQQVSSYTGTMTTWTKQTFDITSMVNSSANFRVRFRLYSDPSIQGTGWYVDDIKITNYQVTNPGLPVSLKVYLEGFWNGAIQVVDTAKIYLANSLTPHALIDSSKVVLSSTGTATTTFMNTASGNYYLVVRHRNHLETWSNLPQTMTSGVTLNYDFTTAASQAFGNNMNQVGPVWVLIGGDINQDGIIDALDRSACWNDKNLIGYYASDVNGDGTIDALDRSFCWNNRNLSIQKPALAASPNMKEKQNVKEKSGLKLEGLKARKVKLENKN